MPDVRAPFDWQEVTRFFSGESRRLLAAGTS